MSDTLVHDPCQKCGLPVSGPSGICPHCGGEQVEHHTEPSLSLSRDFGRSESIPSVEGTLPYGDSHNSFEVLAAAGGKREVVGQRLGNLEIVALIGRGGMGNVYRAEHIALRTPYAVKILHPEICRDPVVKERFRREAVTCSGLRHENIIYVTDYGEHAKLGLYLVMEYLEGVTLEELLFQRGALPIWRALHIAEQVCEGLAAAHDYGTIHRDLKPENIFLVDRGDTLDKVKILDFGIARLAQVTSALTHEGMTLGTPAFMAPEQIRGSGSSLGAWSDLYSLGCLLFTMLSGRDVFEGATQFEVVSRHLHTQPDAISILRPELKDSRLEELLLDILSKDPADRPQTATAVKEALVDAIVELQGRQVRTSLVPRSRRSVTTSGQHKTQRLDPALRALYRESGGDTELDLFLERLPAFADLGPAAVFLAVSGFVKNWIIHEPMESDLYKRGLTMSANLGAYLLSSGPAVLGAERTSEILGRFVYDVVAASNREHQTQFFAALVPLMSDPNFPNDDVPDWAAPNIAGSYAPITRDATLVQKLKQEVTIENIKAVLQHELFRR
jgi:serine/threonine protein kinase